MNASATIGILDLELRLAGKVPRAYVELVRTESAALLTQRGFDPKTLLVLNLELRNVGDHLEARGRLFLNGDGCGNYYFAALEFGADSVLLWSHDPPGIEDPELTLSSYLHSAEQTCRIDWPVQPGRIYICRTSAYAESILDPIDLSEWVAVVKSNGDLEYRGCREGKNPFTGEAIRVPSPGLAAVLGKDKDFISFHHGRATLADSPLHRVIAMSLAAKLGARVLASG